LFLNDVFIGCLSDDSHQALVVSDPLAQRFPWLSQRPEPQQGLSNYAWRVWHGSLTAF
jgi:hypothetical protein